MVVMSTYEVAVPFWSVILALFCVGLFVFWDKIIPPLQHIINCRHRPSIEDEDYLSPTNPIIKTSCIRCGKPIVLTQDENDYEKYYVESDKSDQEILQPMNMFMRNDGWNPEPWIK